MQHIEKYFEKSIVVNESHVVSHCTNFLHIGPFFYVWDVLPHLQSRIINVGSLYIGPVWTKNKIYVYASILNFVEICWVAAEVMS